MMPTIRITIPPRQLADLERTLGELPAGIQKAASRAINKIATTARKEVVAAIVDRVNLRPSDVRRRNVTLNSATIDRLEAIIGISGRRIPLRDWSARQTRKGVSYAIQRGGRKTLPGAFLAVMPSGHVMVAARRPGRGMAKRSRTQRAKYPGSLPIVEQFGPSVPAVVDGIRELSQEILEQSLGERLERELDTQIGLLVQRRGGSR